MSASDMHGAIVCATRGGEGSRVVKERAMALASERNAPLVFLFVIDAEGMADERPAAGGRALDDALRDELRWVGRVLLEMARGQAQRAGVASTLALREGAVRDEIIAYARSIEAGCLLLGAPRGTTANVFGDDAIERFAKDVTEQSGVTVEIVRPEQAG